MRFPESINKNTYFAYKANIEVDPQRTIKADDFDWNNDHPDTLASLCIKKLCEDWNG